MATPLTPNALTTGSAIFDPIDRIFVIDGKIITRSQIRKWLQETLNDTGKQLQSLAARRFEGSLSQRAWESAMVEALTDFHSSLFVVANGGIELMSDAAW